jgi:hypothetical protein
VTVKQPHRNETKSGRIVFFPPRSALQTGKARQSPTGRGQGDEKAAIGDLSEYERGTEADDYPRRMIVNTLAFAFIVALTLAGVWIAETMAMLKKNQDCALAGRRDCANIGAEARDR